MEQQTIIVKVLPPNITSRLRKSISLGINEVFIKNKEETEHSLALSNESLFLTKSILNF